MVVPHARLASVSARPEPHHTTTSINGRPSIASPAPGGRVNRLDGDTTSTRHLDELSGNRIPLLRRCNTPREGSPWVAVGSRYLVLLQEPRPAPVDSIVGAWLLNTAPRVPTGDRLSHVIGPLILWPSRPPEALASVRIRSSLGVQYSTWTWNMTATLRGFVRWKIRVPLLPAVRIESLGSRIFHHTSRSVPP